MGQRIIGLTGGIATGKSTVSDYLARVHHLPVLDADIYARQAVEPGSAVLGAIAARYGASLFHPDGTLNRGKLGEIVFSQPAEKVWLEQQIHPVVRQCFGAAMAELSEAPVVVQVIPLLFEANLADQVSEIWVVTCPLERQRQRLMERNGLTAEQATARIQSQMPLADKVALADVVIDNATDLPALFRQVDEALQHAPEGFRR
ncbi:MULTISPECIES: dephospho-CoA kinase [Cyanophyceae]|uniref:dephospho-CoA kinase n=1 Tax=Cyanophyceae TaxID=3028117 RepID=UPI001686CDFB|nr:MULTISPECIES: dephospho-CoA kinase [Cyanophyceae]MBD1916204.1 dephospho-CoA kinase [Phormidium sp. FACHB-77]MBD2031527.1 dephospho-CoA kinase [Phormidium sp. FACHB-322]MBD2052846.1 dephospho-CoA kinase [Leptolyngbya sp. FACHB-60]